MSRCSIDVAGLSPTQSQNGPAGGADACSIPLGSDTPLADTIEILASGCAGECISIDNMLSALGPKCFPGLLFLFAAPNMLPTPPGLDIALSIPLSLLSLQLIWGARRPWLPAWIRRREISTERFAKLGERLSSITRRGELLLNRRLDMLTGLPARRLIGLVCLALAALLALPIPLGNAAPGAAISLFALGMMARDGIAVLAGAGATIASGVIAGGFGYAAFESVGWLFRRFTG